jgi:hypothetical protein
MWRAAGAKDELGAGPGLHGEDDPALTGDEQPPVEALAHFDTAARIGPAARAAGDLGPARAEADGVVARHGA